MRTAGGTFTAPAGGTILADTGPLSQGAYDIYVFCSGNVGHELLLQYRNAANGANNFQWVLPIVMTTSPPLTLLGFTVLDNERFRIVTDAAVPATKRSSVLIAYRGRP